MARSGIIYGPSGSLKTTAVKHFARYIYEVTGRATLLLSMDGGGWDPCTPEVAAEIIYPYRCNMEIPLSTLRKILGRFVRHRVFYEVSSRNKRGHEFFSTKNTFVVGSIEVVNRDYLTITIFDAHNSTHSIEILNPSALRIYDETMGKGFAVSFLSESPGDVESRCYLRDEGDESDGITERCELEKITLPQLFEYLEEITHVGGAVGPRCDPPIATL